MAELQKTNAARLLDAAGISYRLVAYEVDPNDLSATHVAEQLGEAPEEVYKTIVLHGDKSGYFVCVVPATSEINLKKAAKASGNKKVELIPMKNLLPLTGYIRGGCTAIGMKKPFPVYLQEDAEILDKLYVSAGQRGLQLLLAPADYINYTKATLADISDPRQ